MLDLPVRITLDAAPLAHAATTEPAAEAPGVAARRLVQRTQRVTLVIDGGEHGAHAEDGHP